MDRNVKNPPRSVKCLSPFGTRIGKAWRERGGVCVSVRERGREREARERNVNNPAQVCQTIYCAYGTWYTIYTPRSVNRP